MKRLIPLIVLSACAGQQKPKEEEAPQKQKLVNQVQFDAAVCFPKANELPEPANQDGIIAFLGTLKPQVLECLIDPKNRGGEKAVHVVIETTVSDSGTENKVSGDNLSPAGVACVKGVVDKASTFKPLPKGSPPVPAHAEFNHKVQDTTAVVFGVNESSDIGANIRLGERSWCDCLTEWKAAAPRVLESKVVVNRPPAPADGGVAAITVDAGFQSTGDPASDKVAQCLTDKLTALPLTIKSAQVTVPYPFITLNSNINDELPDAPNDFKRQQYEASRAARNAESALRRAIRINATSMYNAVIDKYHAKGNPPSMFNELAGKCTALLKADDSWTKAIEHQSEVEQKELAFAQAAGEKEPDHEQWKEDVDTLKKIIESSQHDLGELKKIHTNDQNACPKKSYK